MCFGFFYGLYLVKLATTIGRLRAVVIVVVHMRAHLANIF